MEEQIKKAKNAKSDMTSGAVFGIFSIIYFLATFTFQLVKLPNTLTAAFMPRLLGIIVFLCSAYMFLRGLKSYRECTPEATAALQNKAKTDRPGQIRCVLVIADLLAAAIAFKTLGFLLTMPWMMFILFLILEKKEKRKYGLYIILSIVSPIIVFFVFYYGFSQLLPLGILRPFMARFL